MDRFVFEPWKSFDDWGRQQRLLIHFAYYALESDDCLVSFHRITLPRELLYYAGSKRRLCHRQLYVWTPRLQYMQFSAINILLCTDMKVSAAIVRLSRKIGRGRFHTLLGSNCPLTETSPFYAPPNPPPTTNILRLERKRSQFAI